VRVLAAAWPNHVLVVDDVSQHCVVVDLLAAVGAGAARGVVAHLPRQAARRARARGLGVAGRRRRHVLLVRRCEHPVDYGLLSDFLEQNQVFSAQQITRHRLIPKNCDNALMYRTNELLNTKLGILYLHMYKLYECRPSLNSKRTQKFKNYEN